MGQTKPADVITTRCFASFSFIYLRFGHARSLQFLNSEFIPVQVLPPTHVLVLCCLPPLQVAEHPLQLPHIPHVAATIGAKKHTKTFKLLIGNNDFHCIGNTSLINYLKAIATITYYKISIINKTH